MTERNNNTLKGKVKRTIFYLTNLPTHTLAIHFRVILAELTIAPFKLLRKPKLLRSFLICSPPHLLCNLHTTTSLCWPTIHRPSQIVSTAFRDLRSTLVGQRSVLVQHFLGHSVTLYSQLQISFFLKKNNTPNKTGTRRF